MSLRDAHQDSPAPSDHPPPAAAQALVLVLPIARAKIEPLSLLLISLVSLVIAATIS